MKIEPGKFYVTNGGVLVKALMEDGLGCVIGALYEEAEDGEPAYWDAYVWRLDGRFGRNRGTGSGPLSISEPISTSNVFPPIPIRTCDWIASYSNDDGEPCGYGRTEIDAVMDLVTNYPREERTPRLTATA